MTLELGYFQRYINEQKGKGMTDQEIRLQFGEMVGSEMRTARAVVAYFERRIETLKSAIIATLNDTSHLADGDVCTLNRLKDAVPERGAGR
jgi:hypothetical protein